MTGPKLFVWSADIPTRSGDYWFYGFIWGKSGMIRLSGEPEKPRLEQVQVRQVSNGILYMAAGAPYEPEVAVGMYTPMIVPTPPECYEPGKKATA